MSSHLKHSTIYWARLQRIHFACTKTDAAEYGFDDSFIYDELALSRSERQLPSDTLLRDEALAAFEAWRAKDDKVKY